MSSVWCSGLIVVTSSSISLVASLKSYFIHIYYFIDSCERYNGTMCSKVSGYLGGRVFIRRGQSINSWMDIESRLSQIFLQTRYHQRPSKGCQQLLEVLLCHRVFPLCHERKPTTTCGEDCKILRSIQLFCPRVYGEYMSFVTINQNATFLGKMDCNSLTCMDTSVQSLSNESKKMYDV